MAPPAAMHQPEIIYPSGLKLALLMMSIFVGMFLVSLVGQRSDFVFSLRQQARPGTGAAD